MVMNVPSLFQFSSPTNNNMPGDNTGGDNDDYIFDTMQPDEVSDKLAEYTLEGKWDKVVKMYYKFPGETHTTMVGDTVGTALHVAIDLNEEEVVQDLVNAILIAKHEENQKGKEKQETMTTMVTEKKPPQDPLKMVDEKGNTPLHVAASRGFAKLCRCIVGNNNERLNLTRLKNNQGETPLFLAALNWSKHAFVFLSHISKDYVLLDDLVRTDGDSILHCAIRREYFDLAVIIVHNYDFLSYHKNNKEFTPLKVLATRPSAFRSATKLAWWKRILYHCILVEPLEVESTRNKILKKIDRPPPKELIKFPKNYQTLYDIIVPVLKFLNISALFAKDDEKDADPENPSKYDHVGFLPPNYSTFQQFIRSLYIHSLGLSGVALKDVKQTKKKHKWSGQLLKALMEKPYEAFTGKGGRPTDWKVDSDMYNVFNPFNEQGGPSNSDRLPNEKLEPSTPPPQTTPPPQPVNSDNKIGASSDQKDSKKDEQNLANTDDPKETAFLVAARYGIVEMVTEILSKIPSAIHNMNSKKENVLLVAVISRQPLVVETLKSKSKKDVWNNLILAVDDKENTMLHFAGHALGGVKPWQIAGSALQMMWDIKWFQYIKSIAPSHFLYRTNQNGKTAGEIFKEEHKDQVRESSDWLKDTSESCSVVAALVAGVSFATASSVPGGTNDEGQAPLEGQPAFDTFAIASLIGLCFSVTGLIMFLSILTSRKEARDFRKGLPLKLLLGLSSLFVSIAAMFVSFCAGHFFVINHKYKTFLLPFYAATSLPVAFYAVAQFPLYVDLLTAILTTVPWASDSGDNL